MAEGPRLGIDWGKARIGVAACNRGTRFAYPVETVPVDGREFDRLAALVAEYEPEIIYIGLPLTLGGERAIAATHVLEQVGQLAARLPEVPIRLVDERLSTAGASRSLGSAGRSKRQQRAVIDQAAAVEILQRALDREATGNPAGSALGEEE
ncbi:MAG: Holliday junction resolvase RuvX [Propionibacteriaceae bacterium]|nr:Holliday junction resolvase RuvX [Propionibacteriaceae bacterium]